jgi:hypothetical protein
MKSKKRNAAQIAGVLLALGLLLMPCATAMAMNEHVKLHLPNDCGDPETPGPSKAVPGGDDISSFSPSSIQARITAWIALKFGFLTSNTRLDGR